MNAANFKSSTLASAFAQITPTEQHLRIVARISAAVLAFLVISTQWASTDAAPRSLRAGAVASPDRYGALAAGEGLQSGRNAVDPTVGAGFAMAVSFPDSRTPRGTRLP